MTRSTLFVGITLLLAGCPGPAPTPNPLDVKLDPPAHGFQLATPGFDVPAGTELQACYFMKVPDLNNGQPFYVDKIEIAMNVGSHHMNIFRQNTIVNLKGTEPDGTGVVVGMNGMGECFKSANWADWPLVVNSQAASTDKGNYVLQLPSKVGHKFSPGEILMLQTHFVNATTQKTPGRGKALTNFNQLTDTNGVMELGTLFATQQSISVCRDNPTPRFSGFCRFNAPNQKITVIAANGHFHSRGRDFTICPWDGVSTDACTTQKFYESTQWDEPPMATGLNVQIPANGGVSWTCSYQFEPSAGCVDGCSCLKDPVNCCYKFGGIVETSEHCNAFVYYYPKIDRSDIVCQ